jgi:5-formyltetrahydrofolate cyclo-ligase
LRRRFILHKAQSKKCWRETIRAAILGLPPDERRAQEACLMRAFPSLPGLEDAGSVLLYVAAFPEEIATDALLSYAYDSRKQVLCPRVDRARRRLQLHVVRDPTIDLRPGVLGIPEPHPSLPVALPESIDWALVPGIAFDLEGYRLGRGAGYYDRLVPELRPDAVCWALCLDCQLVPRLPTEPHDMPLDGVSSPRSTVRGARWTNKPLMAPPTGTIPASRESHL